MINSLSEVMRSSISSPSTVLSENGRKHEWYASSVISVRSLTQVVMKDRGFKIKTFSRLLSTHLKMKRHRPMKGGRTDPPDPKHLIMSIDSTHKFLQTSQRPDLNYALTLQLYLSKIVQ